MGKRILVIQGHPDPAGGHFDHAVANAYISAAREAGHEATLIEVATQHFALLRSFDEWKTQAPEADIETCQRLVWGAEHLVFVFPLWLGTMPALLKGFIEQLARPGFAFEYIDDGRWRQLLKGRSARIIVTMGMPSIVYRCFYRAHGIQNLKRNILSFVGISPVSVRYFGGVETSPERRERFLAEVARFGSLGQ